MPDVLVITPVYCTKKNRRLPLLLQTIHWVQQQTHRDYLHVVVDDGSTDDAVSVLQKLSRDDTRLMVCTKVGGGSSAAINYGVKQAVKSYRPDYITVCHSDDLMFPNSLENRVNLAIENEASMVYSDEVIIFDTGRQAEYRKGRQFSSAQEMLTSLLQHRGLPYITQLWQADFYLNQVKGFDDRLTSSEDWDIAIRSARALIDSGGRHAKLRQATMAKRKHQDCLRRDNIRNGTKARCYEIILGKHLEGEAFKLAMQRERAGRLQPPHPALRLKQVVSRWLGTRALKKLHRLNRSINKQPGELPDEVERFLLQVGQVENMLNKLN